MQIVCGFYFFEFLLPSPQKTENTTDKMLVYRPFNREEFNFQFSTLNLHDYSVSDKSSN